MNGPAYPPSFYKGEIKRDNALLTTALSPEERVIVQNRIAAARAYLEDPAPSFKS